MKFLFTILFFISISLYAQTYGEVKSEYVRTIDGDTIVVNIPEWPEIIGKNISVRVRGINCMELNSEDPREREQARTAKRLVQAELKNIETVTLKNIERGKYFRIVADVEYNNKNLADILLKNKLAVKYENYR